MDARIRNAVGPPFRAASPKRCEHVAVEWPRVLEHAWVMATLLGAWLVSGCASGQTPPPQPRGSDCAHLTTPAAALAARLPVTAEREREVRATLVVIAELARFADELARDVGAACAGAAEDLARAAELPPDVRETTGCESVIGAHGAALSRFSATPRTALVLEGSWSCAVARDVVSSCEAECSREWRHPDDGLVCRGDDPITREGAGDARTCTLGFVPSEAAGSASPCAVHCLVAAASAVACDGSGLRFATVGVPPAVARYQGVWKSHVLRRQQFFARISAITPALLAADELAASFRSARLGEQRCVGQARRIWL